MGAPEKSLIPTGRKLPTGKDYEDLAREDKLAIQKIIKDDNTQREVNAIKNKFIRENALQVEAEAMQKTIDDNSKNRGGMPKKDFAKPGSYSSAYNKGGMTMRKGNMAYNKGGMGKSKTGHSDYRKGGMVYTTKGKK